MYVSDIVASNRILKIRKREHCKFELDFKLYCDAIAVVSVTGMFTIQEVLRSCEGTTSVLLKPRYCCHGRYEYCIIYALTTVYLSQILTVTSSMSNLLHDE